MQRQISSNRSIKFIKRNSLNFSNVREYVVNLCENIFNINNYEFKEYVNDETALFIRRWNNQYVIYLDYETLDLILIKNDIKTKIFYGDTAWYNVLKYISGGK